MPDDIAAKIDQTVDAWFNNTTHNGPIARDAAIFQQLFAAKDQLKKDLAAR